MDYLDLELNLTEDDKAIRREAQRFATEVMRPIAKELDELSAEAVIAKGSPLWDFLNLAYKQGYHCAEFPAEVGGPGLTPFQTHLLYEELAWGSFGLTILLGVLGMPFGGILAKASLTGDTELVAKFVIPFCELQEATMRGCWAITETDHGSDALNMMPGISSNPSMRWNLKAKLDGDEWVLNGQKAAWISGGTLANYALLWSEVDASIGMTGGGIFFCPLDIPGVTKGKPLEKMGQRDLNQGEIYFDNARIPKNYLLFGPDMFMFLHDAYLGGCNGHMSNYAVGLARAAFDEALTYAKVRVQGGKPIIEHDTVRFRLAQMFAKVESCRAFSRAVRLYNAAPPNGVYANEHSIAAKFTCTRLAYEVADEAMQIFGGNGVCREYLPEKLYRDARASLIEDGNNEVLALITGRALAQFYPRQR